MMFVFFIVVGVAWAPSALAAKIQFKGVQLFNEMNPLDSCYFTTMDFDEEVTRPLFHSGYRSKWLGDRGIEEGSAIIMTASSGAHDGIMRFARAALSEMSHGVSELFIPDGESKEKVLVYRPLCNGDAHDYNLVFVIHNERRAPVMRSTLVSPREIRLKCWFHYDSCKTDAALKLFHHENRGEWTHPPEHFSWNGANLCHPIDHCQFTHQAYGWRSAQIWLPNNNWCMCFNEYPDCSGRTACWKGPQNGAGPIDFALDFQTKNYEIRSVSIYNYMCREGLHVSNHRPTVPYRDQC